MSFSKLYTNPNEPGSFSGFSGFIKNHKGLKIKKSDFENIEAYSIHKKVIRRFPRRSTIVNDLDEIWQVDLIDLSKLKTKNSFFKYILVCIDILSRYAWGIPIKNKEAKSCRDGFIEIFKLGRIPKYIYADLGNEFKGECRKLFNKLNIIQIDTESSNKAAIIERFNKTLKNKIARYFTFSNKENYISVLQNLIDSYNKSYHSVIKCTPASVNSQNKKKILYNLYGENLDDIKNISSYDTIKNHIIKFSFKIGDYVRLVEEKTIFEKGYTPNWTKEIYIISELIPSNPPTYRISSLEGKKYSFKYYKEQLQNVSNALFPYDSYKILKETENNFLVKKLNSENSEKFLIDKSSVK